VGEENVLRKWQEYAYGINLDEDEGIFETSLVCSIWDAPKIPKELEGAIIPGREVKAKLSKLVPQLRGVEEHYTLTYEWKIT